MCLNNLRSGSGLAEIKVHVEEKVVHGRLFWDDGGGWVMGLEGLVGEGRTGVREGGDGVGGFGRLGVMGRCE